MVYYADPYLIEVLEKQQKIAFTNLYRVFIGTALYSPAMYKATHSLPWFIATILLLISGCLYIDFLRTVSRSNKLNKMVTEIEIEGEQIMLKTAPMKMSIWVDLPPIEWTLPKQKLLKKSSFELKRVLQVSGIVLRYNYMDDEIYVLTEYFDKDIIELLRPKQADAETSAF